MMAWNGRAIYGSALDVVRVGRQSSGLGRSLRHYHRGPWSGQESEYHINCLELLTGSFAVHALTSDRVSCSVLLKMDNVSTIRYINCLGGTRSKALANLARNL